MMYLAWCVIRVIQRQLPAVMAWCWTLYFIVLHCCGIIQVMYLAWCVTHIILCRLPSVMAQCSTIKYYQVSRKIKYYPSGVCTLYMTWCVTHEIPRWLPSVMAWWGRWLAATLCSKNKNDKNYTKVKDGLKGTCLSAILCSRCVIQHQIVF